MALAVPCLRALAVVLALAPPALAQDLDYLDAPEAIAVAGAYVHQGSGMTLPTAVGSWERSDIVRFDADALDIGASYGLSLPVGPALAVLFVYPIAPARGNAAQAAACRDAFAAHKADMLQNQPGVRITVEAEVAAPQGDGAFATGHHAAFQYEEDMGRGPTEVVMRLWVYCFVGGPWVFEYRITHPAAAAIEKPVAAFLNGLPWTVAGRP